jgi:cytohesin
MDKNEIKFFLEKNKSNVKSFINEPLITRNIDKFSKKNYWNALSFAIMFADIEIIEILIKYGANVNHRYDNLDSPIHIAIRLRSAKKDASFGMPADYLKIIKLLLKHNADLTLKNKEGYTPIEYAAKYNDTELVKLLESLKNEK